MLGTENGQLCIGILGKTTELDDDRDEHRTIHLDQCKRNRSDQRWHRSSGRLVNSLTGWCLDSLIEHRVGLTPCRTAESASYGQLWHFSIEIEQLL